MGSKPNTAQDFYNRLKPNANGCLEWTGCLSYGYGTLQYQKKQHRAHRLAYELKHGAIPHGMHVCHTCDNPKCCNTDHLFLGTAQDNTNDMINKQRHAIGEKNSRAKLTKQDVITIRSSDKTALELSRLYNVHRDNIYAIRSKRSWKHI